MTFQTVEGPWCPTLTGLNILPKSTGKGRVINLSDIGTIKSDGNAIIIKSKSNDLLFHGFEDGSTSGLYCSLLESVVNYSMSNNPVVRVEEGKSNDDSLENKNALQKQVYFAKKEIEIKAKRKKAQERKDKFMKEAGGLKYTAIAMSRQGS